MDKNWTHGMMEKSLNMRVPKNFQSSISLSGQNRCSGQVTNNLLVRSQTIQWTNYKPTGVQLTNHLVDRSQTNYWSNHKPSSRQITNQLVYRSQTIQRSDQKPSSGQITNLPKITNYLKAQVMNQLGHKPARSKPILKKWAGHQPPWGKPLNRSKPFGAIHRQSHS